MAKNKIYIIDGNSLLFRAYYATAYGSTENIMRNKDGIPTNAIFAFGNMINKIISSFKGNEYLIVGFDTGHKTFRHQEDEDYKANRKPAPQELITQMPIVRDFLRNLGVFIYEQDGIEGDDVCGTVAKMASKENFDVQVFTSDRDFLQLIDDNVTVNILVKGMKDIRAMTPELMVETYGFSPRQIIDFKGLRGDSSDNLPGIPGVGEKTATTLIQKYNDFENIIAHADEIGGKVGQSLKDNQEQGRKCKHLAEILTDIELPFGLEELKYIGYDFNKINDFCQKYELKQLLNRLPAKLKITTLDDIEIEEITSFKGIEIPDEISIALDIADGNYNDAEIFGLGVSFNNHAYYINRQNFSKDNALIAALEDPNTKINCYDYKEIKVALSKQSIFVDGLDFDILLAAYILDTTLVNDIDSVLHYFGVDIPKKVDNDTISLFSENKGNKERIAKLAFQISRLKTSILSSFKDDERKLFDDIEVPLCDVLADMEIEGFPLDVNALNSIGSVFKEKLNTISEEIYKIVGHKFNISSPKQIGEIIYGELGLPKNKNTTSVEALNQLKDKHPVIPLILDYRKYSKLVSTYVDGLSVHVKDDGKIHAMFNQALTQTGRLSSSEPNLQNISVRDEEGKLIRKAFYYPNEKYDILSFDYSQIELRILASLSKCTPLIEIFKSGEDIHSETARKVFNIPSGAEIPEFLRRKAKAVNFGIVYGISDWGLSEQLGISVGESKEIINNFYSAFPEIGEFLRNVVVNATNDGYVSTINGRKRYLREIHDQSYAVREFAKRAAMNAPIQGTAADLIKIAMIRVAKMLKDGRYKTKLVLQIHDELIFKIPEDEKHEIMPKIKEIMEHAMNLDVPLKVEGGLAHTWYDAK